MSDYTLTAEDMRAYCATLADEDEVGIQGSVEQCWGARTLRWKYPQLQEVACGNTIAWVREKRGTIHDVTLQDSAIGLIAVFEETETREPVTKQRLWERIEKRRNAV